MLRDIQQHQQQQSRDIIELQNQLATTTAHIVQQPQHQTQADLNLLEQNVRGLERRYLCAMADVQQLQMLQQLQMQQMQLLQHSTDQLWQLCAAAAAQESAAYRKQQQQKAAVSDSSSSNNIYVAKPEATK